MRKAPRRLFANGKRSESHAFRKRMRGGPLAGTYRPFADPTSLHPVSRRTLAAAEKLILCEAGSR
jgi:hypothetical protein